MERLTERELKWIKDTALNIAQICTVSQVSMEQAIKALYVDTGDFYTLATYEAIGTVEELAALKQAESEGRLAPCNRGDNIYGIAGRFGNKIIKEYAVSHVVIIDSKIKVATQCGESFNYGRSAFLTREEDEAALAAMEGKK